MRSYSINYESFDVLFLFQLFFYALEMIEHCLNIAVLDPCDIFFTYSKFDLHVLLEFNTFYICSKKVLFSLNTSRLSLSIIILNRKLAFVTNNVRFDVVNWLNTLFACGYSLFAQYRWHT